MSGIFAVQPVEQFSSVKSAPGLLSSHGSINPSFSCVPRLPELSFELLLARDCELPEDRDCMIFASSGPSVLPEPEAAIQ